MCSIQTDFPQHLSWCQQRDSWRQSAFSWILWRGGAARGHLRSPASTAGGCDSATLTRVCWCGPTHPICQCNDCSSVAGVNSEGMREKQWRLFPEGRERRDGRRGTELGFLLLVLFSFPLGSEVLFGLVFRVLVYKHDFWSMGTRSLADTFLPFLRFLLFFKSSIQRVREQ